MTRFRFKAVKGSGEPIVDILDAPTRESAIEAIRARELMPISVSSASWIHGDWARGLLPNSERRLSQRDILELTRSLATLLRAGIPLDSALRLGAELGPSKASREFLATAHQALRKGASLADALSDRKSKLPGYYLGLVRAGESNGTLPDTLERLARHLEQSTKVANEFRSAFYYPAIVILISLATVALMLLVVIPEFRNLFDNGAVVPFTLQLLFLASDILSNWGWAILIALAVGLVALRGFRPSEQQRAVWHGFVRRLPVLGPLIDRLEGSRFCRTLGTLQASGMPMLQGLAIAAAAVGNGDIGRRLRDIIPDFRRGEGLASSIRRAGVLSKLGDHLLRVGEESGQLDAMLLRIADIYDEEVKLRLARIEAILIPMLTILMGLFVGGIVMIMLTAILSSYDLAT